MGNEKVPSPKVVHRHFHHHYHHHYVLDPTDGCTGSETKELRHVSSFDEAEDSPDLLELSAVKIDSGASRGQSNKEHNDGIQHVHRHHHSAEVDINIRARTLL